MTWNWTSQFEGLPTNSDRGLVCKENIRSLLGAFKERLSAQHYFDELTSPECLHLVGQCSIVELVDAATTNGVDGALQFKSGLYRDTGVAMGVASAVDHDTLVGRTDHDHPQYLDIANGDTIESGTTELTEINGLPTIDLVAPTGAEVLSKGAHIGVHGSGGCKHEDGAVSSLSVKIGKAKLKTTQRTGNLTGVASPFVAEFRGHDNMSFMRITGASVSDWCNLLASGDDNNDYVGSFRHSGIANGVTMSYEYYTFDA